TADIAGFAARPSCKATRLSRLPRGIWRTARALELWAVFHFLPLARSNPMYNSRSTPVGTPRSILPSTPTAADVTRVLIDTLNRRNGPALGTELASLIKATYPGLNWRDYQTLTFRDF